MSASRIFSAPEISCTALGLRSLRVWSGAVRVSRAFIFVSFRNINLLDTVASNQRASDRRCAVLHYKVPDRPNRAITKRIKLGPRSERRYQDLVEPVNQRQRIAHHFQVAAWAEPKCFFGGVNQPVQLAPEHDVFFGHITFYHGSMNCRLEDQPHDLPNGPVSPRVERPALACDDYLLTQNLRVSIVAVRETERFCSVGQNAPNHPCDLNIGKPILSSHHLTRRNVIYAVDLIHRARLRATRTKQPNNPARANARPAPQR